MAFIEIDGNSYHVICRKLTSPHNYPNSRENYSNKIIKLTGFIQCVIHRVLLKTF